VPQEAVQVTSKLENEQDAETTNSDTEKDEEYEVQFNIKDFVLCYVQENSCMPASGILLDSKSTVDVF